MTITTFMPAPARYALTADAVSAMLDSAYREVRKSWGGVTVSLDTLQSVPDGIDAYAVSLRPAGVPPVTIAEDAGPDVFRHALSVALARFGAHAPYLGIWHDDDNGVIEFDPVDVVSTRAEVDALGAIYPVAGGAYHFATGLGYWPNGKPAS